MSSRLTEQSIREAAQQVKGVGYNQALEDVAAVFARLEGGVARSFKLKHIVFVCNMLREKEGTE